ncbi:uncharacterized protein SCHCODRAFT_02091618 [Schizophyllum commune H4-8]|uniref:uncharacterized protein n=1 Tax=Schizophyllum commune (strain H4-8 / FGSC 9210) TaxID=578458 RepID=UPI00215FA72B|nr:uncharacterized protein SCHCODRAFT_02091618 [Schizophyllum commune H4-8]KAI5887232.1 hypothetical protein SCHCODRAFT_02091618 [Schizophyllum commune H4-8]
MDQPTSGANTLMCGVWGQCQIHRFPHILPPFNSFLRSTTGLQPASQRPLRSRRAVSCGSHSAEGNIDGESVLHAKLIPLFFVQRQASWRSNARGRRKDRMNVDHGRRHPLYISAQSVPQYISRIDTKAHHNPALSTVPAQPREAQVQHHPSLTRDKLNFYLASSNKDRPRSAPSLVAYPRLSYPRSELTPPRTIPPPPRSAQR